MNVVCYRDLSGFDILRAEWESLHQRTPLDLIFMSYLYQYLWWEHLPTGELRLIAIRTDDNQLVGLAPLFSTTTEQNLQQLNLIGCVDLSDYLDILIDVDHQTLVYQALIDYLANTDDFSWDILSLCSLPQKSATHSQFADLARQAGWSINLQEQTVCPVITLPDSWDDYLAAIGKKQRHEVRRKMRKLEAETEARWYTIDNLDDLPQAMADFVVLHQKSTREKQDFWNEAHLQFFNVLAEKMMAENHLKLFFLELNGKRAAALLCFDYDNQFLLYNSGYDPEQFSQLSPGNVLISYTIQEAIRLGRVRYDFLRGDEVYKFRFGAEAEPVYDLEIRREQ